MEITILFQIAILVMSVIIHELSHGYVADYLGDRTARDAGRLTLNPLNHIDLFGSVILPLATFLLGGFVFGYAKPVPYNPYNLRNPKRDSALIAAAGPISNFFITLIFGVVFRITASYGGELAAVSALSVFVVQINILLGIFNLVPIPPLDGSKVLFAILPDKLVSLRESLERYGFVLILLLIYFGFGLIGSLVAGLSRFLLGF